MDEEIPSIFEQFPTMEREDLRDLKKFIDLTFRTFARTYGDAIESFFHPLLVFLVWLEKLLINSPWPIIIIAIAILAWIGSRSLILVVGTIISFLVIGYFGMWKDTMATMAIITVATLVCLAIGIPLGILMARSNRVQGAILPILDMMQTIMMALAMVVIASMIGVKGLGVPILRAINNQYLALGLMNGLAIVALAIIFDRISQHFGKRIQKHREGRNL